MSLNTNLYTIVSQTCEAAGLRKSEIKMKECEEFMYPHSVPHFVVERHKTLSLPTEMCFYPHRDSMLQDMYFALGYQFVMNEHGTHDYLYPEFAKKVNNAKTNELNTATAKLFK